MWKVVLVVHALQQSNAVRGLVTKQLVDGLVKVAMGLHRAAPAIASGGVDPRLIRSLYCSIVRLRCIMPELPTSANTLHGFEFPFMGDLDLSLSRPYALTTEL